MKAIKLEMSAFGPFAGLTTIPFDKLGDTGLYLISGDTGAGKTTIFDAISYALFDSSSGGKREGNMFRSLYAKEDDPTYVEFIFEYKEKIYKINRNPSFERKKKKGDGFMIQSPDASLYLEDGSVISGIKNVNSFVEELLGINENQFKQIAMIAQGDFLKLLHANNNERQDLFRKIFSTGKYQEFEDRVRTENTRVKNEYDKVRQDFQYIAGSIDIENIEDFQNNLLINPHTSKEILEKSIENQKIYRKDNESKKRENETNSKELSALINNVNIFYNNEKEIEKLQSNLIRQRKELEELERKNESTPAKLMEIEELKRKINRLTDSMDKYQTLDDTRALIKKIEKDKDNNNKKAKISNAKLEETHKALKANEDYAREHKDVEALSIKNEQQINEAQKIINNINKLANDYRKLNKLNKDLELAVKEYKRYNDELRLIEVNLKHREGIYIASQTGILASALQDGKPCPVCGSTTHPNKAILSDEHATKEEVDKLRANKKDKEGEISKKIVFIERKKTEKEHVIENIEKVLEEIGMKANYKSSYNKLAEFQTKAITKQNSLINEKERLDNIKKKLTENQELLKSLKEEVEKIETNIKEIDKSLISYDITLDNENKNLNMLAEELQFATKIEAETEIKKLDDLAKSIKKEVEELQKAIVDKKTSINSDTNLIENIASKQDEKYNLSLDVLKKHQIDLETEKIQLDGIYQNISTKISINETQLKKLDQTLMQFRKLEVEFSHVNDIYRTVAGQISGKDNIKFEVFVQMNYFDDIISRANKRFLEMTNGQFSLKRRQDASNKSIQSGLEIELIDEYSSKARDIKTLSGGESFKAALSLALGLSDTVQMYSGGVELDSMFVDEGFGTLDKQSLNQVMTILNKLTSTKKLIGIISHVDSLKETIDRQIKVTKNTDMTSEINMIV